MDRIAGLDLHLDRPAGRTREALMDAVRDAIRSGRLVSGTRLPSSRALAADLGVARNTVARAYAELIAEGWLTSQHGSHTTVSQRAAEAVRSVTPPARPRPPRRLDHDLRPGHPDLSSFPRTEWSRAVKRALANAPSEAFGYAEPQGRPELRRALAEYLARARGVRARPCNIVVCCGAAEGLNLVAGALAEMGVAATAVEAYGLPTQRAALARAGLRCPPLAVDADGADINALNTMPEVGAVLLTPSHQFPLGVPLHSDRRAAVIDWARRTGGMIIEDDYDGEFRYDRQPVGALQSLDPEHVAYLGSASKSLAQTLRVGWMALPQALVEPVIAAAGGQQFNVDAITALTLADFIATGGYDRHIRRMRNRYRRRRDHLVEALSGFDVGIRGLAAGVNMLLTLPDGAEPEVLRRAGEAGIALSGLALMRHPLAHPDIPAPDGIIVGFGAPAEHAFRPAVEALRGVLEDVLSP